MAGELVLIVEDNERNMKLLRDVLCATGYRTLEATSAAKAVELATQNGPDVVLMDIRLPDADGIETLDRLRADRRTASIPVLAVTAQAMHGDRERFLAAGFDDYVAKPVDVVALIATVDRIATDRSTTSDGDEPARALRPGVPPGTSSA